MKIIRGINLPYIHASHEDPQNPGSWKKVLLSHGEFPKGKVMMVNWAKIEKGREFRSHFHEDMDELFIIIKGTAKISVAKEKESLATGDAVLIAQGAIHRMENTGLGELLYLAIGISRERGGKTIVV